MNNLESLLSETADLWAHLKRTTKPIVLYGMGDGADKILKVCGEKGIPIAGVFASDAFVRGQHFQGFTVLRFSDLQAQLGDMIVLLAFGTQSPALLSSIEEMANIVELYAPDVPVYGGGLFDFSYAHAHEADICAAYALMADALSRRVFCDTLHFKLSGKPAYLKASETPKAEAFHTILQPQPHEFFVDMGAYTGDTIAELLTYTGGQYSHLLAMEPDGRNLRRLAAYAANAGLENMEIHPVAAWKARETLCFAKKASRGSTLGQKGVEVLGESLDNLLNGRRPSLIKMDVEGAEKEALQGAANALLTHRPRLNIAAYHRNEDLFALPLQIHALCPQYKIYLRHHPYLPAWDTNLYCV